MTTSDHPLSTRRHFRTIWSSHTCKALQTKHYKRRRRHPRSYLRLHKMVSIFMVIRSGAMVSLFHYNRTPGSTESNWKQRLYWINIVENMFDTNKNTTWGIFLYCVVGESVLVRGNNIWPWSQQPVCRSHSGIVKLFLIADVLSLLWMFKETWLVLSPHRKNMEFNRFLRGTLIRQQTLRLPSYTLINIDLIPSDFDS